MVHIISLYGKRKFKMYFRELNTSEEEYKMH